MIRITVTKHNEIYQSFRAEGHADYADREQDDIICAAVSALTINTANAIGLLTDTQICDEQADGYAAWHFKTIPGHDATLLMDALILGLQQISEQYDKQFVSIEIQEV